MASEARDKQKASMLVQNRWSVTDQAHFIIKRPFAASRTQSDIIYIQDPERYHI